jgi:recombinational DNA repair protein RecR
VDTGLVFSIIGAAVTLGSVFIGIGVIKSRLADALETNAEQAKQIEKCAARDELAAAIRRSDEMLAVMQKRADEDRAKSEGQYKEFYAILSQHTERLTVLETNQQAVTKTLEEIRKDLNGGFKDIREELREMRKQG